MTLNPCSCGEVYLPKGDRYSPDNGLRVRVITSDTYYDDTLLHNVDVLVSDEQLFLTVAPRTRSSGSVYAQAIILYLGSKFTVSPTIKNSIQIVIRVKETKQILINRTIGILGDSYKFIRNPLVSNNFALSFNQNDILNTVDLNGKTLQFEIYSLCDNYTASCCEKLPTSMFLFNTLNINCPATTTTTTTTPPPTTTTTTTTTLLPSCNWDGNAPFILSSCAISENVQFTHIGGYTWTYSRDLGCGSNRISALISCNPSVYLTTFNPTTCAQKWTSAISMSCGSLVQTGNDGTCTNDKPPLFTFTSNFTGCLNPELCCLPTCSSCVYEWRTRSEFTMEGWYYVGGCSDSRQCTGGSSDCTNLPLGEPCLDTTLCPPFGLKQTNEPIDESCIVSTSSGRATVGPIPTISYYCADDGSGGRACSSCSTWGIFVSNCPSSTTLYSTQTACAASCS